MPRWSSDGTRLAYAQPSGGTDPGKTVVAVLSTDERQEQLVALQGEATMRPSDWSRDGRTILGDCRIAPGQPMGICSIPAPGKDAAEPRLKVLSAAPIIGEAIRRNFMHQSIGDLFAFGVHEDPEPE